MIEHIINAAFQRATKPLPPTSAMTISLRIPEEYDLNPQGFIDIIRHLYIANESPGFVKQRAAMLIDALQQPGAPSVWLAQAGPVDPAAPRKINITPVPIGTAVLSTRMKANMQDGDAMVVLQEMVNDRSDPFRYQAIDAMVEASLGR